MRLLSILVLSAALLPYTHSQNTSSSFAALPSCTQNCFIQCLPTTQCASTDIQCLCVNKPFLTKIATCIPSSCSVKESLTARNITAQLCDMPVRDKSLAVTVVPPLLFATAAVFVLMRLIARLYFTDIFGWDDGLVLVALGFGIQLLISQIFLAQNGNGRDIWTLPFDHITQFFMWFYITEVAYCLSTAFTKFSILVFYLRIFPSRNFKMVVMTLIVISAGFGIASTLALAIQCVPVNYVWNGWSGESRGTCIDLKSSSFSQAALNMVLDAVILSLPLPTLFKLQLNYSWKKKLRVMAMFSIGLLVTVVSAVRLTTLILFAETQNPTWDYAAAGVWSAVECYAGIICACLPGAKVFFVKVALQGSSIGTSVSARVSDHGRLGSGREWTGVPGHLGKRAQGLPLSDTPADGPLNYKMSRMSKNVKTTEDYGNSSTDNIVENKENLRFQTTIQVDHISDILEGGHLPESQDDWQGNRRNHGTVGRAE